MNVISSYVVCVCDTSEYQKKPKPIKRQVPWKKTGFLSKRRGFRIPLFWSFLHHCISHAILSLWCSMCKFSQQHGPHNISFSAIASAASSPEISILHKVLVWSHQWSLKDSSNALANTHTPRHTTALSNKLFIRQNALTDQECWTYKSWRSMYT